jgi:hypothetical protein
MVQEALRRRDPLGLGMPGEWAVKLLRRLLRWNAEERITAQRALQHAFFRPPADEASGGEMAGGGGYTCGTGSAEYEFADDAAAAC